MLHILASGFPIERLRLTFKPGKSTFVPRKEWPSLLQDFGVVLIDPSGLGCSQQTRVDQLAAIWDHRDMLEAKVRLVAKGVLSLYLADYDHVFDPDAICAVFVIPRLDGHDIAGRQGHLGILDASANADRAFVDIQEAADTMARAVPVVKTLALYQVCQQQFRYRLRSDHIPRETALPGNQWQSQSFPWERLPCPEQCCP